VWQEACSLRQAKTHFNSHAVLHGTMHEVNHVILSGLYKTADTHA